MGRSVIFPYTARKYLRTRSAVRGSSRRASGFARARHDVRRGGGPCLEPDILNVQNDCFASRKGLLIDGRDGAFKILGFREAR